MPCTPSVRDCLPAGLVSSRMDSESEVFGSRHGPKGICREQEAVHRLHSPGSTGVSLGHHSYPHFQAISDKQADCCRNELGLCLVATKAAQHQLGNKNHATICAILFVSISRPGFCWSLLMMARVSSASCSC
eukprot:3042406-Rhodomonas_salina.1